MATVRLSRRDVEADRLPRICVRTGVPTDDVKVKRFTWTPGWVRFVLGLSLLACIPGILLTTILAYSLSKSMTLRLPMVREKHGHWRVRQIGVLAGAALSVAIGLLGVVLYNRDIEDNMMPTIIGVAGMGIFLLTVIVGGVVLNSAIRAAEITDRTIKLAGVHRNFKSAVQALRADAEDHRDDEEDEYEPRRQKASRYEPPHADDEWRPAD